MSRLERDGDLFTQNEEPESSDVMVLSFKRKKEEKYTRYTEIMKGFEILLLFSSSVNSKISLCGRSCPAVDQTHFLSLLGAGLD